MALPKLTPPRADTVTTYRDPCFGYLKNGDQIRDLAQALFERLPAGTHLADSLLTWGLNNSLLDDGPFMSAWQRNIEHDSADSTIIWRRYILACAGYHAVQLDGDFVECGCYKGTGVKTVVDYLGGTAFPKPFWAYDLFEHGPDDIHHAQKEHSPGLYDDVRARFRDYPGVRIIRGRIPEVFVGQSPERIAYLHLDLNQAPAEIATLDALFDRVVSGGIIILDDYEWSSYRPQKLAEDPWFEARSYRVFPLPTGQGMVLKR